MGGLMISSPTPYGEVAAVNAERWVGRLRVFGS